MDKDDVRRRELILGVPIDVLDWSTATARITRWGLRRESRVVCICNVHSIVTARQDPAFATVVRDADMATPDGAPVAWVMRRQGCAGQDRINGPDLMWKLLQILESAPDTSVFFYGSAESTLKRLKDRLETSFPRVRIAGMHSPPFRDLTPEEEREMVDRINASGAGIVLVSLGCPKQELWMFQQKDRVHAVMIGVGAAFDYHAGVIKRAPLWMQRSGLEWLHRLASEPRRLWRRYAITNTAFIWALIRERQGGSAQARRVRQRR